MSDTLINTTVDAARTRMQQCVRFLDSEIVALGQAHGRILAQDVFATRDQPPFSASAMDGYSLRSVDAPGNLRVVGVSAAGAGFAQSLQPGEAVRIFTGAAVPDGADAVAIQEDVRRDGDAITVPTTPGGQHVRPRGLDFKKDQRLIDLGATLDGIALALAAATGCDMLHVIKKARVTILSGGDEIVAPGRTPGPFQIYDSLSVSIAALLTQWGADARVLKPQRDDATELSAAYTDAFADADLVITIGGASVGDRDLMKPALAPFSPVMQVDKVAVRPGKPTWFATTQHAPVLGLPGNPASALVCAHLFAKPILDAFHKASKPTETPKARLTIALPANGPREHYLRSKLVIGKDGAAHVTPAETQDSSLLSVFHAANALVRLPPNAAALAAGDLVDVIPLNR